MDATTILSITTGTLAIACVLVAFRAQWLTARFTEEIRQSKDDLQRMTVEKAHATRDHKRLEDELARLRDHTQQQSAAHAHQAAQDRQEILRLTGEAAELRAHAEHIPKLEMHYVPYSRELGFWPLMKRVEIGYIPVLHLNGLPTFTGQRQALEICTQVIDDDQIKAVIRNAITASHPTAIAYRIADFIQNSKASPESPT